MLTLLAPTFLILTLFAFATPVMFQDLMMYFPRRYSMSAPAQGGPFAPYTTTDGLTQWGYRVSPTRGAVGVGEGLPAFYLVFYGNASLATDMAPLFEHIANHTGCSFFIVDYRGYGFNPGKPNERGMTADAIGAYDTLKAEGAFERGVGVIGHSIGAAVAVALAEARPVDRMLLISPFTSVGAMARATVPWPLSRLARNDWPNDERLARLLARPEDERPAAIGLIHGERDEIIPASMSRELAALPGGNMELHIHERAMHNDIIDFALNDVVRFLRGGPL
jgi:uncharacterized protein